MGALVLSQADGASILKEMIKILTLLVLEELEVNGIVGRSARRQQGQKDVNIISPPRDVLAIMPVSHVVEDLKISVVLCSKECLRIQISKLANKCFSCRERFSGQIFIRNLR